MTIKHEALRLFLAVTALILTAMISNPNDSQGGLGIDKTQTKIGKSAKSYALLRKPHQPRNRLHSKSVSSLLKSQP